MGSPPLHARVSMLFAEGWLAGRVVAHRTLLANQRNGTYVEFQCQFDDGTLTWIDPRYARLRLAKVPVAASTDTDENTLRISTRCCLSFTPLIDPARGEDCTHMARCNHDALLDCIGSSRSCPVAGCDAKIRFRVLVRDVALRDALRTDAADAPPSQAASEFRLWNTRTRTLSADHLTGRSCTLRKRPSRECPRGSRSRGMAGAGPIQVPIDLSEEAAEEEWEEEEWEEEEEEEEEEQEEAVNEDEDEEEEEEEETGGEDEAEWTGEAMADQDGHAAEETLVEGAITRELAPAPWEGSTRAEDERPLPLRRPHRTHRVPRVYEAGPSDAIKRIVPRLAASDYSPARHLKLSLCDAVHLKLRGVSSPTGIPTGSPGVSMLAASKARRRPTAVAKVLDRIIYQVEKANERAESRRLRDAAEVERALQVVLGKVERAVAAESRRRWKRMRARVLSYFPANLYGTPPALAQLASASTGVDGSAADPMRDGAIVA